MAKPGTGGAIKGIDKAGDLANKIIEVLADVYDPNSLEAQGIGLAGDLANGLVDGLGSLAGQCHFTKRVARKYGICWFQKELICSYKKRSYKKH